jgi:pyruvate/2-oxoglutarate dehydrogenase complex dihydrolipoamide dehydrogenase (E3) component
MAKAEGLSRLIVLGSGYIALEFSQAMRRFGSKVTIVARSGRLLHREDEDISEALRDLFVDEGIDLVMNAQVKRISGRSGDSVRILIDKNGGAKTLEGTHLLVALGRVPNTTGIGLEQAGIEVIDRGCIRVKIPRGLSSEVLGFPWCFPWSSCDFSFLSDRLAPLLR